MCWRVRVRVCVCDVHARVGVSSHAHTPDACTCAASVWSRPCGLCADDGCGAAQLALKALGASTSVSGLRLWGKLLGTGGDYIVAEGVEEPGDAEDAEDALGNAIEKVCVRVRLCVRVLACARPIGASGISCACGAEPHPSPRPASTPPSQDGCSPPVSAASVAPTFSALSEHRAKTAS